MGPAPGAGVPCIWNVSIVFRPRPALGPADRLPVGREHQPRASVRDLNAMVARLEHMEEEGLLHRTHVFA
jgi:hypothetical protein